MDSRVLWPAQDERDVTKAMFFSKIIHFAEDGVPVVGQTKLQSLRTAWHDGLSIVRA